MTGWKKNLASYPYNMKLPMVDLNHKELSLYKQTQLLGISRSFLYYTPKSNPEDERIMEKIDYIYTSYPFYWARRIREELKWEYDIHISRYHVWELMRKMWIQAIYAKKKTSIPNKEHEAYPYLLRDIPITHVDQVWSTDITYIKLKNGWVYLSAVIDWYSKKIISWKLSNSMDITLCLEDLHNALEQGTPEIFNTDQWSQYTSKKYTSVLEEKWIQISMDWVKRCLDNVYIERFWRSLKYENIYIYKYETMLEAHQWIAEYIEFYNTKRVHQSLGYCTPLEVYQEGCKNIKKSSF